MFFFQSPGGVFSTQIRGNSSKKSSKEFIDLRFEHSVFVHGVYVYETLNPGSIIAIWAGNCKGKDKFYQNFTLHAVSDYKKRSYKKC